MAEEKELKFFDKSFIKKIISHSITSFCLIDVILSYINFDPNSVFNSKTNLLIFALISGILLGFFSSIFHTIFIYVDKTKKIYEEYIKAKKNVNGLKDDNLMLKNRINNLEKNYNDLYFFYESIIFHIEQGIISITDSEVAYLKNLYDFVNQRHESKEDANNEK